MYPNSPVGVPMPTSNLTMADVQAMMQPGGALSVGRAYPAQPAPTQWNPATLPTSGPPMTQEIVQAMIDESLNRALTPVASPLSQFDSIFQRALPPEDFAAFTAYVQRGAPGFGELLKTDALDPIAQLLWETIKEKVK